MMKDNKKRLFEVFQKVNKINLKEWYDDDYGKGPEKVPNINPNDINQVREFHTYLMLDGIEDIYDYWKPSWMIDELKNNGYIAEDPKSYAWYFTEEGKQKFSTPEELQKWILSQWNTSSGGNNDSEAPYLRGRED